MKDLSNTLKPMQSRQIVAFLPYHQIDCQWHSNLQIQQYREKKTVRLEAGRRKRFHLWFKYATCSKGLSLYTYIHTELHKICPSHSTNKLSFNVLTHCSIIIHYLQKWICNFCPSEVRRRRARRKKKENYYFITTIIYIQTQQEKQKHSSIQQQ